jgi:hypothetical protein
MSTDPILEPTTTTATLEVTGAPPTDLTGLLTALMLVVMLGAVVELIPMEEAE